MVLILATSLADPDLAWSRVGKGSQVALDHLANIVARQLLDEDDAHRNPIRRQSLPAPRCQSVFAWAVIGAHHKRPRHLAEAIVGYSHNSGFAHPFGRQQHVLDGRRETP